MYINIEVRVRITVSVEAQIEGSKLHLVLKLCATKIFKTPWP